MADVLALLTFFSSNLRSGLLAVLGVLAAFVCFFSLGSVLLQRRSADAALIGMGVVYLAALLFALAGLNFKYLFAVFLLLGVSCFLYLAVKFRLPTRVVLLSLALALPLILLGAVLQPFNWDSYSNWLEKVTYLLRYGHFLEAPLDFPLGHPTYPEALPLVMYFANKITGVYAEATYQVANVFFSLLAVAIVYKAAAQRYAVTTPGPSALLSVVAFTLIVALNPCIQNVHYWSAMADPAIAVVVFATVVKLVEVGGSDSPGQKSDLFYVFICGVLLNGIKQASWMISLILILACTAVALRNKDRFKSHLPVLAAFALGSALSVMLWSRYLQTSLPIVGHFSVMPFDKWRFDLLGDLAKSSVADVLNFRIYYFAIIALICVGAVSYFTPRLIKDDSDRRLLMVLSLAMLMHLGSLFLAYLGTGFLESEIRRAASLQRYSAHIGYSLFGAACIALLRRVASSVLRLNPSAVKKRVLVAVPVSYLLLACFWIVPTVSFTNSWMKGIYPYRLQAEHAINTYQGKLAVGRLGDRWWAPGYARYLLWTYHYDKLVADAQNIDLNEDFE
jgi:hypothetical protein